MKQQLLLIVMLMGLCFADNLVTDSKVENKSVHDVETEKRLLLTRFEYTIAACYLLIITVIGLTVNGMVFYITLMVKKLRTPMNTLLVNLACSDFGIALLGNPVALINAMYGGWAFSDEFCKIYGFIMSTSGIASIFNLSILSFYRFILICRPLHTNSQLSWYHIGIAICGSWTLSIAVSIPPFLGWGYYAKEAADMSEIKLMAYLNSILINNTGAKRFSNTKCSSSGCKNTVAFLQPDDEHLVFEKRFAPVLFIRIELSCSIDWQSRDHLSVSYIKCLFLIAMGGPVVIITFSYGYIIITVKQRGRMSSNRRHIEEQNKRASVMIFVMVIAFFVAWGPYAIFSLLVVYTNIELSTWQTIVPSLFAKSSVCYNPVIYFYFNRMYRTAWYQHLGIKVTEENVSGEMRHIPLRTIQRETISDGRRRTEIHVDQNKIMTKTSSCDLSNHSHDKRRQSANKEISKQLNFQWHRSFTFPPTKLKELSKTRSLYFMHEKVFKYPQLHPEA